MSTATHASDMMISDSTTSDGSDENQDERWVSTFLNRPGNQIFVEIDEQYLTDRFNLVGLNKYFDEKMSTMLRYMTDDESFLKNEFAGMDDNEIERLESNCGKFYGMIHARYILTFQGQYDMMTLYREFVFGKCPRLACECHPLLPVGLYDVPDKDTFKLYCPMCEDIYLPKCIPQSCYDYDANNGSRLNDYKRYQERFRYEVEDHLAHRDSELAEGENLDNEGDDLNIINQVYKFNTEIDGCYFGTTFPHFFLLQYPKVITDKQKPKQRYIPRVYDIDLNYNSKILRYQELKRQQLEEKIKREVDPKLAHKDGVFNKKTYINDLFM
ncbi:hypothetical protein QEN19_002218 [Hanseniaspora menglaensis]